MAMSTGYLNAISDAGKALVTHIGLVNGSGTELSGGTYARVAAGTIATSSSGQWRLPADLTFNVPSGATVAGWRAFSASTAGTNYGGDDLTPEGPYAAAGQYVLTGSATGVNHTAA